MLRKDYILRMVEQIQRAMAQVALKRQAGDPRAAEQLLDQASSEYLGLGFGFIAGQPVAQLKALFSAEGELDVGKCIVAGELFEQNAGLLQDRGEPAQSEAMLLNCLDLFLASYRVLPERERRLYAGRIMTLLEQLTDHAFAVEKLLGFVAVYEAAGRYDRAEDLVFELVDGGVAGALELGLKFYDGLLGKKDRDLVEGGLPRDEVEDSLRELKNKQTSS